MSSALSTGAVGGYQLQAAIAACHDDADSMEKLSGRRFCLVRMLERATDNPMVALNRAVAVGMVRGPTEGLRRLEPLATRLGPNHQLSAVCAHLLDQLGEHAAAGEHHCQAGERTASLREHEYLLERANRVAETPE